MISQDTTSSTTSPEIIDASELSDREFTALLRELESTPSLWLFAIGGLLAMVLMIA